MPHPLYKTARWLALRDQVKAEQPICGDCGRRPTKDVHHVERHGGDPVKFFGGKLLGLCRICHAKATARERGQSPPERVDVDGYVHPRE